MVLIFHPDDWRNWILSNSDIFSSPWPGKSNIMNVSSTYVHSADWFLNLLHHQLFNLILSRPTNYAMTSFFSYSITRKEEKLLRYLTIHSNPGNLWCSPGNGICSIFKRNCSYSFSASKCYWICIVIVSVKSVKKFALTVIFSLSGTLTPLTPLISIVIKDIIGQKSLLCLSWKKLPT